MAVYPPPVHLLRDLRATTWWVDDHELRLGAPLQHAATDALGVQVGVIAALVGIAGAVVASPQVAPDRCTMSDLSYQRSGGVVDGPIVISTTVLRAGAKVVTVRSEVFDGRGAEQPARHAGTAVMTFARIATDDPRAADDPDDVGPTDAGLRSERSGASDGFARTPHTAMGLRLLGPGVVRLDPSPYVLGSSGTVCADAASIMLAAAAESMTEGAVAADLSVHRVGPAARGPLQTVARELADYDSYVSVDVELVDISDHDRLIATSTVGLVRE